MSNIIDSDKTSENADLGDGNIIISEEDSSNNGRFCLLNINDEGPSLFKI